jgi:hypothetical protein
VCGHLISVCLGKKRSLQTLQDAFHDNTALQTSASNPQTRVHTGQQMLVTHQTTKLVRQSALNSSVPWPPEVQKFQSFHSQLGNVLQLVCVRYCQLFGVHLAYTRLQILSSGVKEEEMLYSSSLQMELVSTNREQNVIQWLRFTPRLHLLTERD